MAPFTESPHPLTVHLPRDSNYYMTVSSTPSGDPRLIGSHLGNWCKVPPASGTQQTLRKRKKKKMKTA